jgi:predicted outer membrane protein
MVLKPLVRALVLGLVGAAAIATAGDQAKPAPSAATPAAATPQPPPLDEFVPSEKVKADEAVAFPVDI